MPVVSWASRPGWRSYLLACEVIRERINGPEDCCSSQREYYLMLQRETARLCEQLIGLVVGEVVGEEDTDAPPRRRWKMTGTSPCTSLVTGGLSCRSRPARLETRAGERYGIVVEQPKCHIYIPLVLTFLILRTTANEWCSLQSM